MWTVYCHTTPNGKKYIGITSKTAEERWANGRSYRAYFASAIKKYGWNNIKHEILYENLEEEQAKLMEISLIHHYKTNDKQYGYNMTNGGDGTVGLIQTVESNHKRSETQKGKKRGPMSDEHKANLSKSKKGCIPWNKGKTNIYTDETCKQISNSLKGKQAGKKHWTYGVRGKNNPNYGKHWWNDGKEQIFTFDCPEGFVPGMLKRK